MPGKNDDKDKKGNDDKDQKIQAPSQKVSVTEATFLGYHLNQHLGKGRQDFLDAVLRQVLPLFAVTATNLEYVLPRATAGLVLDLGSLAGSRAVNALGENAGEVKDNRHAHIHIALIGEAHNCSDDAIRAQKLSRAAASLARGKQILLVEERKLRHSDEKYQNAIDANHQYVNEASITNTEFSEFQRSVAVAAYVFLQLANGSQGRRRRVLVFFGENHIADIQASLEYFIMNSVHFPWVARRLRTYFIIKSTA